MDFGVNVVAPAGKGSLRRRPRAKHDGIMGVCVQSRGTEWSDWGLNPGVLKHHAGGMLSAYREAIMRPYGL